MEERGGREMGKDVHCLGMGGAGHGTVIWAEGPGGCRWGGGGGGGGGVGGGGGGGWGGWGGVGGGGGGGLSLEDGSRLRRAE